jgi:hypothetical protein
MRKSIAVIIAASSLLLAGCCTTPHATRWEYKVAELVYGAGTSPQEWHDRQQTLLTDLGKDGWELVQRNETVFYFKRPIK